MEKDWARSILKKKYGKGVTNVTSEKFDKADIPKREKLEVEKLLELRRLRRSKDIPQKIINKKWKDLKKDVKDTEKIRDAK